MGTSGLSIGTESNEYTSGDQLVVAHWLGDEDTSDGIKRLYYLPRTANWVQDEIGRLLYIVNRGDDPKIVDVKENMSYDWILDPPGAIAENAFEMTIVEQGELNVNRDLAAIVEGEVEKGGIHTIFPTPSNTGVYIDIRAQTDITEVLVAVANVAGDYIRTLYEGSLAQGGHRFF